MLVWLVVGLLVLLVLYAISVLMSIPRGRQPGLSRSGPQYQRNPNNVSEFIGSADFAFQAHIPMGMTQYYLVGPESGPKIVLLHGITPPACVFKELIPYLAGRGFRLLAYDLYGRGFSEAPECKYNKDLYVTQLQQLTDHLGWKSFGVLGFSLGGAIAVAFTNVYPERVSRLGLVGPAGLLERLPFIANFVIAPVIGDLIGFTIGKRLLIEASSHSFNSLTLPSVKKIMAITEFQIRNHPGFMRSYLSTLRNFPLAGMHKEYAKIGTMTNLPVNVLWGTKDTVIPFSLSKTFQQLVPHAKIAQVVGGSHSPFIESPDAALPLLAGFFL